MIEANAKKPAGLVYVKRKKISSSECPYLKNKEWNWNMLLKLIPNTYPKLPQTLKHNKQKQNKNINY